MTGLSSTGETAVLAPLTSTAYVSLHTADPGNTGASEVTGGAYVRQGPIAFASAGNNPTVASNSGVVTFPAATAAWGTIGFFGLWDAATAGNFRGSGALVQSKPVSSGDTVKFLGGTLTITAQ
jgi:hypothetical protein